MHSCMLNFEDCIRHLANKMNSSQYEIRYTMNKKLLPCWVCLFDFNTLPLRGVNIAENNMVRASKKNK